MIVCTCYLRIQEEAGESGVQDQLPLRETVSESEGGKKEGGRKKKGEAERVLN